MGEEELRAAAGARAGLRGRQALGRAQARAAAVWEEAWIRCAGPFLTVDKVGWAVFMGLSSLFSCSMTIGLLFFLFF